MEIQSWKTAIKRNKLSMPVQWAVDNGVITKDKSIFDFGCGRGQDVKLLNESGYYANGWDPYFYPKDDVVNSDIINLGYVLNVIPNITARSELLKNIFVLARETVIVSVRHENQNTNTIKFNDGFITSKNTFQKFYTKETLLDFIHRSLDGIYRYKKENVKYIKECFCIIEK